MRKQPWMKFAAAFSVALLLAACGGEGGLGTNNNDGTTGSTTGTTTGGTTTGGTTTPAPTVGITASPTSAAAGATITLTWTVSGATSCTASGAWSGAKTATGGTETATKTAGTNTFTLACTGAGGTTTSSATVTDPVTPVPTFRMGILSGSTFTPDRIAVSPVGSLNQGSTATLSVDIVNTASSNARFTGSATIIFSSPCATDSKATLVSPATATNASITTTYTPTGCIGSDTVTATTTVSGQALTATVAVVNNPSPPSSIAFVSATPANITLRGSGGVEAAKLIFLVADNTGLPVRNQTVNFALSTALGGITLNPASATTDQNGQATTIVNSGTVATSVRVTAAIPAFPAIPPAQSSALTITTGLADQNSFSLSVGCFNIEGHNFDGVQTNVSVRASDRFNNPVPDNTAVTFTTEADAGQIEGQCLTAGGACSVMFTSSGTRTADHRVTILATTPGEESFTDTNGNGSFDSGETFSDLGEAYLDANESGTGGTGDRRTAAGRDSTETFRDFNNNGAYNAPNGAFTGVVCSGSGCTANSLDASGSAVIIMSGSGAAIDISPTTIDLSNGPRTVLVSVADSAGQPVPGNSKIEATTTLGKIAGDASFTQPCTSFNGASVYAFTVEPPATSTTSSGTFQVKVTTPKNVVSTASAAVSLTSTPPAPPPPGNLNSVQFVSATPQVIGIRGSGQQETSTLLFNVVSDTGAAMAGVNVDFSLDSTIGGVDVVATNSPDATNFPRRGVTSGDGQVSAIVRAGTVHTSVRVTATASTTTPARTATGQSSRLTISTGLPDQNSFSLSAEKLNIEGDNFDGITSKITARLSDRFNNPAPDGTAISFTAEGGSIGPECQTIGGACFVTFTSTAPRTGRPGQVAGLNDHRYTILATAVGEESFTDLNGNGRFDMGEPTIDLTEAYLDGNENAASGVGARDATAARDAASEVFLDFDNDGAFDLQSGNFTGVLCSSGCDSKSTLHVSNSLVIVMSGSGAVITAPASISTRSGFPAAFSFTVADSVGQSMAGGTKIEISSDYGTASVVGGATAQVDTNANSGTTYSASVARGTSPGSGTITIKITTPQGIVTTRSIPVNGPPQCNDGVDNDGDGAIDNGVDAQCTSSGDDTES